MYMDIGLNIYLYICTKPWLKKQKKNSKRNAFHSKSKSLELKVLHLTWGEISLNCTTEINT